MTVVDGQLDRKNVTAMAYEGAGRLIDLDTSKRQLLIQDPGSGSVRALGKPGAFPAMSSPSNGLDIAGGKAFAVVNLDHVHTLFAVNLADGTRRAGRRVLRARHRPDAHALTCPRSGRAADVTAVRRARCTSQQVCEGMLR